MKTYLVLCLLLALTSQNTITLTASPSITTINSLSNYTFLFYRDLDPVTNEILNISPVALNSVITITFPSSFSNLTSGTYTCSSGLTCSMSGNILTVNGYYATTATLSDIFVTFVVEGIMNPGKSGTSGEFLYTIQKPDGTVQDTSAGVGSVLQFPSAVTLTPGVFQSCGLSTTGVVYTKSSITFTATPTNRIPSDGRIVITLPQAWTNSYITDRLITGTLVCSPVTIVQSTVTCSYEIPTVTLITVGNLSNTNITSQFSFTFSNVTLPPTVSPSDTISIYSSLASGETIDTCTTTLSGVTAASLQNTAIASTNQTVSRLFNASVSFINTVLIATADTLVITVPASLGMPSKIGVSSFVSFTNVTTGNVITIANLSGSTLSANNRITVTLFECTNPPTTKQTSSLTVQIERTGRLVQSGSVTYQSTAGTLTATLASASFNTNSITSSQLTVITSSPLAVGSYVSMVYSYVPKDFTAAASISQCTVRGSVVNGATYALSNRVLVFSNIFATSGSIAGNISINFTQFTNPPTTQTVTLTVSTYSIDNFLVDTGSLTYTAVPATLPTPTLVSSNYTVLSTATITISFVPSTSYTSVSVITPTDIVVTNDNVVRSCASNKNEFSSCSFTSNNLTFSSSNSITGDTTLSWGNSVMPASFSPTGRFQIYTYFNGWLVQSFTGLLILTMNATAEFTAKTAYLSSLINNQIATFTVNFTMPSGSPNGFLRVFIPSPVVINSGLSCKLNSVTTTCGVSGRIVSVSVNNATLANTLAISNVTTPPSLEPTANSVTLSLVDLNSFSSIFSTISQIQNTQTASMSGVSFTVATSFYGQSASFTISATLNGFQSYILITPPTGFATVTVGSTPCTGCTVQLDNLIRFNTTNTTFSIQLTLTTSNQNTSNGFTLASYSSTGFAVQSGTTSSWFPTCASTVCRNCSGTTCLNCYTNSSISLYTILKDGTCTTECPQSGYYLVGTICSPCDSNCAECSKTNKNCTACKSGTYLDSTTNSCVVTCPDQYYKVDSTLNCSACIPPCLKCNSNISCISCHSSFFLFGTSCLSSCTANTYIQNTQNRTCDPCSSNCLTCQNSTFTCTSCNITIPLYLDKATATCVTVCTGGLVVKDGVCTACQFPCKTCSVITTNCTSCNNASTNPLLFSNTCITGPCPLKFYANLSTASCQSCPAVCATCTSATVCTSCESGYYYYNSSSCITACPDGTWIENNLVCKACNASCKTCSTENVCLICAYPLLRYGGICYAICPPKTYSNSSQTCTDCINSCLTCLNATFCLSCVTNSYLYATKCWQPCPSGTYLNDPNCTVCPTGCTTCSTGTYCLSCNSGYSMQNNLCVVNCSVGISHNQICYPCGQFCAKCEYTCTNCTPACSQCDTGYSRYNLYCMSQCPITTISVSQVCQDCSVAYTFDCLTCNATQCLTCNKGALLDGKCQECPSGQFASINVCIDCPVECLTCFNNSYCYTCVTGRYLHQNKCVSTCPVNMIPAGSGCVECVTYCSLCDQTTTLCLVCQSGHYIHEGGCVDTCPENLTISVNGSNCLTKTDYYKEYSQVSKSVYFPFTIISAILLCMVIIFKCKFPSLHFVTFATAVVSIAEIGVWILFLSIEIDVFYHGHTTGVYGAYCLAITFAFLLSFNLALVYLFHRYFTEDVEYQKWVKKSNHHCSTIAMLSVSACTSYKFFRISYSRLLEKSNFCLDLTSPNSLRPMNALTISGTFLVTAPAIIAASLAMYYSIARDLEFWAAFDCLVTSSLGGLLALLDLHHNSEYFSDDFEAKNINNVYKLEADNQSDIKVQFDEDEHAEINDPTMGKTFFKALTGSKMQAMEDSEHEMHLAPQVSKEVMGTNMIKEQVGSQHNLLDDSEELQGSAPTKYDAAEHWVPAKRYDQFGYQIRRNTKGQDERYDASGLKVVIKDGKHLKYDSDGYRIEKSPQGQVMRFDKEGFQVKDNGMGGLEKFDARGYKVVDDPKTGQRKFYNDFNYEVMQKDGKEVMYDSDGDIVKVNPKTGEYDKYDQHGFRIYIDEGGSRDKYDQQGFRVQINPQTGEVTKYDSRGYRMVQSPSGQRKFYDRNNFLVTQDAQGNEILRDEHEFIVDYLAGNVIKRYDDEGLEVVIDQSTGKIKKYDIQGYEVREIEGKKVRFEEHGFRVEKNYYGGVTLYDQKGYTVEIDSNGNTTRRRQDGLKVGVDKQGKEIFWDNRGNQVIFDEEGNFTKIDPEGNEVWLDDYGYEIGRDADGNEVKYDLAGNPVKQEDDDIILFEQDNQEGDQAAAPPVQPKKDKKINMKLNKKKQINLDEELEKMIGQQNNKHVTGEEGDEYPDMRLSELQDIYVEPIYEAQLEDELNDLLYEQRFEISEDFHPIKLTDLKEIKVLPKQQLIEKEAHHEQQQPIEQPAQQSTHEVALQVKPIVQHSVHEHEEELRETDKEKQVEQIKLKMQTQPNQKRSVKRNPTQQSNRQNEQESKVPSQKSQKRKVTEKSKATEQSKVIDQGNVEKIAKSKASSKKYVAQLQEKDISTTNIQNKKQKLVNLPDAKQTRIPTQNVILPEQDVQSQIPQPKSVRDVELSEKTQENNGVQVPIQQFDVQKDEQSLELDKNMIIEIEKKAPKKNYVDLSRSQMSHDLPDPERNEGDKDLDTKTQYKRKDLQQSKAHVKSQRKLSSVDIQNSQSNKAAKLEDKPKGKGVYDPNEQIQSLNGSIEWDDAKHVFDNTALNNPPIYNAPRSSAESVVNIRAPVINYIEQADDKDTLSDYVDFQIQKEKTVKGKKPSVPKRTTPPADLDRSIEVQEQRLFFEAAPRRARQLSNTPNPLITYAQTIDNDRYEAKKVKNLEKIYLQQSADSSHTMRKPKK